MSSNQDYSFMKTGFNNHQPPPVDDGREENITALVVAYAAEALKTAAKYVSHGSRTVVTTEDIKRAMMLEIFLFNKRPNLLEKATDIKQELYAIEEDDEEDDDFSDVIVDDDAEEMVEFSENECECALCMCIAHIHARWENWEPATPFEKLFRKHIEKIE